MNSRIALTICIVTLGFSTLFYYPKWSKPETEATLSWDVSGYYFYLPALFIYGDLKELAFAPKILEQYVPTPNLQQAFQYHNGNYVMKYSSGQALMYLPFFMMAHMYASMDASYPADGFSYPYQVAIGWGSLLIACLGLWMLRKILLRYYPEQVTAWTLLILVATTNYLEYAGITGAMTHNWLFTLYTLLIWLTIQFYERPSLSRAMGIGVLIGLAALTRPTEIVSCLIPVLWGINHLKEIKPRIQFFLSHLRYMVAAAASCIAIGAIQVIYWKWVAGDFLVYSYEEEGFSWLNPYFTDALFSYKAGWITYSPAVIFMLMGIPLLFKKEIGLFWAILCYVGLHLYITFAWDIWWYGGSLGQRSMVQSYPMLAFALAAFLEWVSTKKVLWGAVLAICGVLTYYNVWLVYQAHGSGTLYPSEMTGPYFWEVAGRYDEIPIEALKLLDTDEQFKGERQQVSTIYTENFDNFDPAFTTINPTDTTDRWLLMNGEIQFPPNIILQRSLIPPEAQWLRVNAQYFTPQKEWTNWQMTQLVIRFMNNQENIKERIIRVHRLLSDKSWKTIFMDTRIPKAPFTHVDIFYWNAESQKELYINSLEVEAFH